MSEARFLRYARQDGISQWWKETIALANEFAEAQQWRRLYWLACELKARHECGEVECGETGVCRRCYTLTHVLWRLGGNYWRYSWDDLRDAIGYSHGRLPHGAVPARPAERSEASTAADG